MHSQITSKSDSLFLMTDSVLYLVQFGRPGFLGRFRSGLTLARGERIVLRGPRGFEAGEVLLAADPVAGSAAEDGAVLRRATAEDDAVIAGGDGCERELLARALARAEERGLPLAFVDVEVLLDGTAILHAVHWDVCDATDLLEELSHAFGLVVRLLDLLCTPVTTPAPSNSCGKPGCGSEGGGCSSCGSGGGGGCSTGSCSRGSVTSSRELTSYFSDLREKMEEAGLVRRPLN